MSVYTQVSETDLKTFLSAYPVGELQDFTGIYDGIENTNYFVRTNEGEFVLTLFEHMAEPEINFSMAFINHLANQGLPCAHALQDQAGNYLGQLHDKPTSLVTRLAGRSLQQVGPHHCRELGRVLAQLHLAGQSFQKSHKNARGAAWRRDMCDRLAAKVDARLRELILDEVSFQEQDFPELPQGLIHSDLFRDNVLFTKDKLTGLLDLYDAGYDLLLYDLAITATDWCRHEDGRFDQPRLEALLQAYHLHRPVSPEEQKAWPVLLRRAALRFLLSRLYSLHFPRDGHLTQLKDPDIYPVTLEYYRQTRQKWPGFVTPACG